jgi:TctA family transporter
LRVPYRFLFPSALFFICVGVYSTNNSLFQVGEVVVFGLIGALLVALEFPVSPILLGYVLGPMVEENFRRAMLLSRGSLTIFTDRPIALGFLVVGALLIVGQLFFASRNWMGRREVLRNRVSLTETASVADD